MNKTTAVAWVLLVASTAGCGTDGPNATPDPTATSPATSSPTASPTASPTTPSPAPATGPLIQGNQVSFHVPKGWKESPRIVKWERAFANPKIYADGQLFEQPAYAKFTEATPQALAHMVVETRDTAAPGTHWRRLPDVTIAGLPAYRLVARTKHEVDEQYGTLRKRREIVLEMHWLTYGAPAAQRRLLTEQILASFQLK